MKSTDKVNLQDTSHGKSDFDIQRAKRRQEFSDRMLERQQEFFTRIFPNDADKAVFEYQGKMVRQKADQNLEIDRVIGQFKFDAMVEVVNHMMIKGASWLDGQAKESFMQTHIALRNTIKQLCGNYQTTIESDLERLDSIKNDRLRSKVEETLFMEIESMYDLAQGIIADHLRHAQNPIR